MKKIILREHGILPDTDCTFALHNLTEQYKENAVFVFEDADYFFESRLEYPYNLSNTDPLPTRKLGIWLKNAKNIHFEGNGARLWFSGQMQPFTLDHCENCTIENFVVDWKKPLVAEGIVRAYAENYVDLFIDPQIFPHRLTAEGRLEFDTGNNEWYPLAGTSHIQYDRNTRTIRRGTSDNFVPSQTAECVGKNIYRLPHYLPDASIDTAVGNIFVLRHNERLHAGIFTEKCDTILVSDVTFHSTGGLGCLAQFCKDMTYRRVHFLPNEEAGRKICSGRDDGMHITCCSGNITITECSFLGLMDDPINVHSCCIVVDEIIDRQTIRCRYMHSQACGFDYWAENGDTIHFIHRDSMHTFASAEIDYYTPETREVALLHFKEALPDRVLQTDCQKLAVDNISHTAAFTCTKNRFGSCRARGVLVSTPQKVRISENIFESSGSAILIAGDSNFWFESGRCLDIEIFDNVFMKDCLSSMYQFTHGIISICPVVPKPNTDLPYHENIRIFRNIFDTPNLPVLYGFATAHLTFRGNRIFRAYAGEGKMSGDALIRLEHCCDVCIKENSIIGKMNLPLVSEETCHDVLIEK